MLLTGYIQLITSLLSIFYTTAQFPQQVRLQKNEKDQIKLLSIATFALLIWRTLIVGSRILAFVLFATFFHCWLFAVVGFHYLLMFAMVFYQLRLSREPPASKIVQNVVTPLVYVFDFCVNWLSGPTFYWYLFCYVPMYSENVLMSGLVLWSVSSTPSPAWYIVPGCVCVIVMFPMGVLVQLAYYRYWHPWVRRTGEQLGTAPAVVHITEEATQLRYMSWSTFRDEVVKKNRPGVRYTAKR